MSSPGESPSPRPWSPIDLLPGLALAAILLASFLLKLRNLDHTGLTRWDEVFHAVVARNLLKHPLEPTLVDVPYLPYDWTKWGENHVWLHKPILPLWQIALSFALLGVDTFALRLPSALLATGAAWITYLIGKELLDRRAGLVAAALQAVNPFLVTLVQGYQFADHVDVALLFWVEVGVYFLVRSLRTGSWRDVLLAGLAQGLAYLSKSYLAAIIFGIALTAWLLPVCRLARREECRIGPARLLALLGVTLLTVAPWLAHCLTSFPQEFWYEHQQIWRHLGSNVENWAAPWDRVVFDYLIVIHGVFYTSILVAAIVLVGRTISRRHAGSWLVYAWGLGVLIPHLFAVTKTPSATLLAVPPLSLLLGYLVSEAWRGERLPLAALTGILVLGFVFPAVIKDPGHGYPSPRVFAGVMRRSPWVIEQVAGALTLAFVVEIAWAVIPRRPATRESIVPRVVHGTVLVFCLAVLSWLGVQTVKSAWRITSRNVGAPSWKDMGTFVRTHLPDDAVLLCDGFRADEHLTAMFYADRTSYPAASQDLDEKAREVIQAGGIPYVVSHRRLPLPLVHSSDRHGLRTYQWQEP